MLAKAGIQKGPKKLDSRRSLPPDVTSGGGNDAKRPDDEKM
jgi:hypothetical protein